MGSQQSAPPPEPRIEMQVARQEEIFREEVRRHLDENKPRSKGLSHFVEVLNKPFTLWVLSSVVVSLITWQYQSRQEEFRKSEVSTLFALKVAYELINRMDTLAARFEFLGKTSEQKNAASRKELYKRGTRVLADLRDINKYYLFPEYTSWSLEGLLYEISVRKTFAGKPADFSETLSVLKEMRDAQADLERELTSEDEFNVDGVRDAIGKIYSFSRHLREAFGRDIGRSGGA